MFGSKPEEVKARGVEGQLTAQGFSGRQFLDWEIKGGYFSRTRTGRNFSELTADQQKVLDRIADPSAYVRLGQLSGQGALTDRMAGWSMNVSAKLENEQDFAKLVNDVSTSIGKTLLPELERFQKDGETLAATAVRLGDEFEATNTLFMMLGAGVEEAFKSIGLSSTDAREAIIAAAGGLDSFKTAAQTYYAKFFTSEEQLAMLGRQLTTQFDALGVKMPATRAGFRSLIESLDLTTESGQKTLGSLLALSGSMDEYYRGLESGASSVKAAAKQISDALKGVAATLRSTIDGVLGSGSPQNALQSLTGRFDEVYASAKVSTGTALSTYAQQLSDLINPLLSAASDYYASGPGYQELRQYVLDKASQIAIRLDEESSTGERVTKPVLTTPPVSGTTGTAGVVSKAGTLTPPPAATADVSSLIVAQNAAAQATISKLEELRLEFVEVRRYLQRQAASA